MSFQGSPSRPSHVWPIRESWVVGGPAEKSRVSLKLMGSPGEGQLERERGQRRGLETGPLTPCGSHYPAGLFAPERCQRPGDGDAERRIKLSVMEDSSRRC